VLFSAQAKRYNDVLSIKKGKVMNAFIGKIKSTFSDWLQSTSSKRLFAGIITAIFVTIASNSGYLSEDQAYRISGIVIALIIGDSYRPINPNKVTEDANP
tara:strand:- start:24991 stop:25290 length:300 start_codon:yes stop_codon:yes gene_type:complete